MTSIEISSKQKWDKTQLELNAILKKEIELMREVLANLHEEELSLLERDLKKWATIMDTRSELVMQLLSLRQKKTVTITTLEKLALLLSKKEILPAQEESSCEILSQLDQLLALLERTNLQNCRNDALFDQAKKKEELPLYCSYPHPLHQPKRASKKTSIIENNNGIM